MQNRRKPERARRNEYKKKVSFLEWNGKYLVMNEQGKTCVLSSEEKFNKFVKENNFEILN